MFVRNRNFKDEENLLEALFDFELGTPAPIINEKRAQIELDLKDNKAFHDYVASLTDEEDRMEVETEERNIRLAESLMADFNVFKVLDQKLFGLKGDDSTLLYELDL